jgi:hypothetical protein
MSPDINDPLILAKIAAGRACVRIMEAVEVLASGATQYERVIYAEALDLTRRRLRNVVRGQEPEITVQILLASEGAPRLPI